MRRASCNIHDRTKLNSAHTLPRVCFTRQLPACQNIFFFCYSSRRYSEQRFRVVSGHNTHAHMQSPMTLHSGFAARARITLLSSDALGDARRTMHDLGLHEIDRSCGGRILLSFFPCLALWLHGSYLVAHGAPANISMPVSHGLRAPGGSVTLLML